MAKNELLPFADGEDANVLPTNQWEALTDILKNGFQSGIARSEQVNRVLAQGAVASYVLGQLIVDQLNKDATLDKNALYQNLILALQENAKDACLPLSGGNVAGNLTVQGKNVVRSVNGTNADASGNVAVELPSAIPSKLVGSVSWNLASGASDVTKTISGLTPLKPTLLKLTRTTANATVTVSELWYYYGGSSNTTEKQKEFMLACNDTTSVNRTASYAMVIPRDTTLTVLCDGYYNEARAGTLEVYQ